jgi:sterol 14-demethylase
VPLGQRGSIDIDLHLVFCFFMAFDSAAPATGYVAAFVDAAQQYVAASPGRVILLGLFYTPILVVVLNILKQLVSV